MLEPDLGGRPLWWRRREPIEGASAKDWVEGGLLFVLELVVLFVLLGTISALEATGHLGEALVALLAGLSLMVGVWVAHRLWIRRDTEEQIAERESGHDER